MVSNGFNHVKIQKAIVSADKMRIQVNNVFELIQAVGYIKFMLAQRGYGIAFRGEHKYIAPIESCAKLREETKGASQWARKNNGRARKSLQSCCRA